MKERNATSQIHRVGDIVYYGRFTPVYGHEEPLAWKILEATEDELLLITRDCVLYEPYYYCYGSNVAWKDTSLYKNLKESFFEKAFTSDEAMFLNPFQDKEYCTILSKGEIEAYMKKPEDRASWATPFADSQFEDHKARFHQIEHSYESSEDALERWRKGGSGWSNSWWVRGEEEAGHPALCVINGGKFIEENHMSYRGVRPCIRLALRKSWQAVADSNGQLRFHEE